MWALPHALHHATQRVVGFVAFYALFWLLRNNPLTQFSLWILPHALHHATQRVVGFVAFYA
jgi:hypothetical protein